MRPTTALFALAVTAFGCANAQGAPFHSSSAGRSLERASTPGATVTDASGEMGARPVSVHFSPDDCDDSQFNVDLTICEGDFCNDSTSLGTVVASLAEDAICNMEESGADDGDCEISVTVPSAEDVAHTPLGDGFQYRICVTDATDDEVVACSYPLDVTATEEDKDCDEVCEDLFPELNDAQLGSHCDRMACFYDCDDEDEDSSGDDPTAYQKRVAARRAARRAARVRARRLRRRQQRIQQRRAARRAARIAARRAARRNSDPDDVSVATNFVEKVSGLDLVTCPVNQYWGEPTADAEEGDISDTTTSVKLASTAETPAEYEFYFPVHPNMEGDYTISITAQLGEGATAAEWKVDMFDFQGIKTWVSVGDLTGVCEGGWTTITLTVETHCPEDFASNDDEYDSHLVRLYTVGTESIQTVYVDEITIDNSA